MRDVRLCARCVMPNTRPRVQFDAEGVCNACRYAETKAATDWAARRRDFETLIAARLWNVDPFGQPAVEQGKALTRKYLSEQK